MTSFDLIKEKQESRLRKLAASLSDTIRVRLDGIQYNDLYECDRGEWHSTFYLGTYDVNDLYKAEKYIQVDARINSWCFTKWSAFGTFKVHYSDPKKVPWPELSQKAINDIERRAIVKICIMLSLTAAVILLHFVLLCGLGV